MLFSERDRWHYANCQLKEVICQLRFPAILSINENPPADFQDAVREAFPIYELRKQQLPPKLVGAGTPAAKLEPGAIINQHNFLSSTGIWKIVLTQDSIALSTMRYNTWEDFAQRLDRPLADFIRIYQPAAFERIGLRYLNLFSRKSLALEDTPWRDLIQPAYLGVLNDPSLEETQVNKCVLDTQLRFSDNTFLKLHAGPGRIKQNGKTDEEARFILDLDCSTLSQTSGESVPNILSQLHSHASAAFLGAITDTLHTAMGAESL